MGQATGYHAGHLVVGRWNTRGDSQRMSYIHTSANKTLAFKPGRNVTRNPKQGHQWPPKGIISHFL